MLVVVVLVASLVLDSAVAVVVALADIEESEQLLQVLGQTFLAKVLVLHRLLRIVQRALESTQFPKA